MDRLLLNLAICRFILVATVAVHTMGMMMVLQFNARQARRPKAHLLRKRNFHIVSGAVLIMFLVSLFEVLIWACTYLVLNAIEGLEKAIYFSMVTFTTLGYGDVLLDERWQLLASFEAANGIIMFGWTTAIIMAVVQRVHFRD